MQRIFALIMISVLALAPLAARAAEDAAIPSLPPIVADYDVYVGGVHLVEAHILFQQAHGAYHTTVDARTHGFWHDMLPWNAHLEAAGRVANDRFVPLTYDARDEWKHKPKLTHLRFDKKGGITASFEPPEHDANREIVSSAQKKGALDPITALMQMLAHITIAEDCNVTVPVFDGKRRFDVSGIDAGEEYIDEADYGVFKGTARTCDADFKMIAGEWQDRKPTRFWQKSATEAGREPFHVWLGPIGPKAMELPVRLESGSVFGLIVVHLTKWRPATAEEVKR